MFLSDWRQIENPRFSSGEWYVSTLTKWFIDYDSMIHIKFRQLEEGGSEKAHQKSKTPIPEIPPEKYKNTGSWVPESLTSQENAVAVSPKQRVEPKSLFSVRNSFQSGPKKFVSKPTDRF